MLHIWRVGRWDLSTEAIILQVVDNWTQYVGHTVSLLRHKGVTSCMLYVRRKCHYYPMRLYYNLSEKICYVIGHSIGATQYPYYDIRG